MPDIEFSKKVILAIDERISYYNSEVLPSVLDQYRLIHTCVKNLIDILVQKSIIKPDPYKLEKKSPMSKSFQTNLILTQNVLS